MPRLRLRVASSGVTHKLDLPAGCSWEDLQNTARQAVGLDSEVQIVLSLNKKTPVAGTLNDTLNSLGVCSGDLLWLLAPDLPESHMHNYQSAPTSCEGASRQTTSTTVASSPRPQMTQPGGPQLQGACDSGLGVPRGPGDVRMEESPNKRRCATDEASALSGYRPPVEQELVATYTQSETSFAAPSGVSLKLRRLLMGESTPANGAASATSSASMWSSLSPATRCLLLLDCVMAEAGFESMQDLPTLAATHPTVVPRQLLYTCSFIPKSHHTRDQVAGNDADIAGHSPQNASVAESSTGPVAGTNDVAMLDAGDRGALQFNGTAAVVSAAAASSTAASARAAESPVAKLLWYCMGRYLVVHGAPRCAQSPSPPTAIGNAAPVPAAVTAATLHIDLTEYGYGVAPVTAGGDAQSQPQTQSAAVAVSPLLVPRDAAAHWRRLKDGLVLPLLVAACRAAGLAPPLGLTVLPLELQMSVMRRLQPRDLAILGCTCSALHRLAEEDELWRPLFEREFVGVGGGSGPPCASAADLSLANVRGYKHVFGLRWRDRVERQRRRQMFRPGPPPLWTPPPPAPFIRPPFMPPGSIGGDYDRLPGPLMGFGPGHLGAGPGLFGRGGRGIGPGPFRGGTQGGISGLGH